MNKSVKGIIALVLACVMLLSSAACGKTNKTLDLNKFPMVYADDKGLEILPDGADKPTLLTKNFYTFLNYESKVQASANGKIYYLETKNKQTIIGNLYEYDVAKQKSKLVKSGVYDYKVNNDGSSIVINNGTGSLYKYEKKYKDSKDKDIPLIQKSGVAKIIDISANGKYVIYTQLTTGSNSYTLLMAKTDYVMSDAVSKYSLKTAAANKDISKAPIVLTQNYKEYIGADSNLSAVYFTSGKNTLNAAVTVSMFKNYKQIIKLSTGNCESYFVDNNGRLMYSVSENNTKKFSDIITDKYAESDKTVKKTDKKAYAAKKRRDNIREKIEIYLKNITTTTFYKMDKSLDKPEKITEISGQLLNKGVDKDTFVAFFGTTRYNFDNAKKPDIEKVSVAYVLFDDIKSRDLMGIGINGLFNFEAGKGVEYNSADCFVDTQNNKINVIMNFDYLKTNVGTLYTAAYTAKGFEKIEKVSSKAVKLAHFNSASDVYFVNSDSSLVRNNANTVVMKNYGYSSLTPETPVVFMSVPTGKKDKYGNALTTDTAYMITSKGAQKLGKMYSDKGVTPKASAFAYFETFDVNTNKGKAVLYNGSKLVQLGDSVSIIYNFTK